MKPRALFTLAGAIVLAGFVPIPWLVHHPSATFHQLIPVGLVLLAIPSLLAVPLLARFEANRYDWALIFVVGLLARGVFLTEAPYLSTDVYRYIWDGRVQVAGLSPYGVAPIDASLDRVEADLPEELRVRQHVNHDHLPTIYPPLTELVFRVGATVDGALGSLSPPLLRWRLFLMACEVGIALVLISMLRGVGRDSRLVLLYLWHPLPVVEVVWSAHAEIMAVLLFLLALRACAAGRARLAGLALGLAGAAKLLPFALVPYLWRRLGVRPVLVVACCATITLLPFLGTSPEAAFGGIGAYAEGWYFNDITFRLLGGALGVDVENRELLATRVLRGALFAAFVATCAWVGWRQRDPYRVGLVIVVAFVVLSPTLHPWYLLWLLPLAIVRGERGWLLLTVTVLFSHRVSVHWAEYGVWREDAWVRCLEFLPPLALVAWDAWRARS